MTADRSRRGCPGEMEEERIAALAVAWEDDEAAQHLFSCPHCARLYVDHLLISDDASPGLRRRSARSVPRRRRPSRPLLAAASLLLACAIAVGGYVLGSGGRVITNFSTGVGRVGEFETRTGMQLSSAGLPAEGQVAHAQPFVIDARRVGTALVVALPPLGRLDVVGVDERGRVLWRSSSKWEDWNDSLGAEVVTLNAYGSVVARREKERIEEVLVLAASRGDVAGLFCIEPLSGRLLGSLFHVGVIGRKPDKGDAINVLPAPEGTERQLLAFGGHGAPGTEVTPCAIVFRVDGTIVQHVSLPTSGLGDASEVEVVGCEVDWTTGHELVRLTTTENITFDLPIVDGRLDIQRAGVLVHDSASTRFAAMETDPERARAWLDDDSEPRRSLERQLAPRIRETEVEEAGPWTVR